MSRPRIVKRDETGTIWDIDGVVVLELDDELAGLIDHILGVRPEAS